MGCTRIEIANKAVEAVVKTADGISPAWVKLMTEYALEEANKASVVNPLHHKVDDNLRSRFASVAKEKPKETVIKKEGTSTATTSTPTSNPIGKIQLVKNKDGSIRNQVGKVQSNTVKVSSIEELAELSVQLDTLMHVVNTAAVNERWENKFKELGIQTNFKPITIKLLDKPIRLADGSQDLAIAKGDNGIEIATDYKLYGKDVDGKKPVPFRIILHEYAHTITQMELSKNPNSETVKKLKALYDRVKGHESLKGERGIADVSEFVAEALANPGFQSKLDKISSTHTIVNKIKELFKTMLAGLTNKGVNTALDEVLDLTATLLSETKEGTKAKDGKISQYSNTANSLTKAAKGCAK